MDQDARYDESGVVSTRPWIDLKTTYDVEAWIENFNRALQLRVKHNAADAAGCGICFCLAHGGEIYLHTTGEGEVLLDVTPDAQWVAPLITAATQVGAPQSAVWVMPGEVLTQLIVGLSGLIASTRLVLKHDFKLKNTRTMGRDNW